MRSSPGFECLARLLALRRGDSAGIARLCGEIEDWTALLGTAADYGVYAPAAARVLPYLPDSERPAVARALAALSLRDAYLLGVLKETAAALEEAGVTAVALKGPVMAERLFPQDEPRASGDLDLLVLPEQLDAAVAALNATGYAPEPASLEKRSAPQNPHLKLIRDRSVALELHYRASADFARPLEAADLVARAMPFRSRGGFEIRVLAPEDEFLFLVLHAAKHNYGLWQMYDLKLLVEQFSDLDWRRVSARLREGQFDSAAYVAMKRMERLWGSAPELELSPNWVVTRRSGWLDRRLDAAAMRGGRWRQTLVYALLCDPLPRGAVVFAQRAGHFGWRVVRGREVKPVC